MPEEQTRLTVHMSVRLAEKIRDASVAIAPNRGGGGVSSIIQFAVEKYLTQYVKRHGRIPKRTKQLRRGPRAR